MTALIIGFVGQALTFAPSASITKIYVCRHGCWKDYSRAIGHRGVSSDARLSVSLTRLPVAGAIRFTAAARWKNSK
jgi:hypothetical protein